MTAAILPNRRELLLGAALGGAALALPRGAMAAAPKLGPLRPTVYRFALGGFEVTTVLDGAIGGAAPHPTFGENASADEVAALAAANFLPADKAESVFTVTLVNTGTELVLFDTGNADGRRPNAGQTRARLAAAGVTPEAVDVVVLTHFHPDHIGGLVEAGAPAYPNARYVTGATEHNFWTDPALASREGFADRLKLIAGNVVPLAPKMSFIKPGDSVASGITALDAHGHTPGHMAYHLESEGRRLVITADTANHYVLSMQRPDWHVRFDMDKDAGVAARKAVLGMIAADKIPFVGYHMPFPSVGYLEPLGPGFRYVPVSYQLNL